jgi:undecaprenyl-diphosphatase
MTWEFDVLYALQGIHNPVLDKIMVAVSLLGNSGILWIALGLILLIPQKYRKVGIEMIVSMAVTFVIGNLILKNLVARDRPCWIDPSVSLLLTSPPDYSFPSGHSMNGFAGSVILLLNDKRIGIPAILLAVVIAFSRLYNFVHFPTDVLAGILIGTVVALLVDRLFAAHGWKTTTL